jgi:pre-rRNA-processing protein TSR1
VARPNKQKNRKFKGSKPAKQAVAKKGATKTKAISKVKQPKKTVKQQRIRE